MKYKNKNLVIHSLLLIILLFNLLLFSGCVKVNTLNYECEYSKIGVGEIVNFNIEHNNDYYVTNHNEDIVKIENNTIQGLKVGNANFTVISEDLTIDVSIEVVDPKINFNDNILLKVNEEKLIHPTSSLIDTFNYDIEDKDIASINNNIIKGLKAGETILTISYERNNLKIEKKLTVKVEKDPDPLILNNTNFSLEEASTLQLDVTKLNEKDVINYSVEDDSILSVSDTGLLTGLKAGKTNVHITSSLSNFVIIQEFIVTSYVWPTDTEFTRGVYLGVDNYGTVTNSTLNDFSFKFNIQGNISKFKLAKVNDYELHNILEEGNIYELTLNGNTITNLVKLDNMKPFGEKESLIVEGYISSINKYNITINEKTYSFLESCKPYKITKAAGGTSVTSTTLKENDYVRVALSKNNYVQNIYLTLPTYTNKPVLNPVPGERTLTNFFKTALSAVGRALYVYGGAWDYQDVGSSFQARSIGVADSWVQFFYEQSNNYHYKNTTKSQSYYPFGAWNEYYYAGVDCSGYVGWIIYNIMNNKSGNSGYVMGSTKMAKTFASYGWGTYTRDYAAPTASNNKFKVGDIISMDGHVWICLGLCSDYSMVILHSTPSDSRTGNPGGGAQLGAIGSSTSCEAYILADNYNKNYYKDWYNRYQTSLKSYSSYLSMNNANCGKFSWNLDETGLTDPDNLSAMDASHILEKIFK